MRPTLRAYSWYRLAALVWASLWMLAAPLFHIHPEADHRHGQEGHRHGGTVHTAWSPDLDCEYDGHRQVDRIEESSQRGVGKFTQFSHVGDRHTEFSLSLLSDSTDRKSLKPFWAPVLGSSTAVAPGVQQYARMQRGPGIVLPPMPFVDGISSRAPPSLLV